MIDNPVNHEACSHGILNHDEASAKRIFTAETTMESTTRAKGGNCSGSTQVDNSQESIPSTALHLHLHLARQANKDYEKEKSNLEAV